MENASNTVGRIKESSMVELTGKIVVVTVILIFLVAVFIFLLRRQLTRRRRRFDFSPGHQENMTTSALRKGLDPSLLKTIPVVLFNPKELKQGLECAVCLCDVCEGEMARLLPKCNHGFHVDCIDMWFQSHSTCPLCRNPISLESILVEEENSAANFPTNVLFWGNESQVSTLGPCLEECLQVHTSTSASTSTASLLVDIPRQINEEEEEEKSPIPTRLRSLKRLLSRDRRASPRVVDVEQGAS